MRYALGVVGVVLIAVIWVLVGSGAAESPPTTVESLDTVVAATTGSGDQVTASSDVTETTAVAKADAAPEPETGDANGTSVEDGVCPPPVPGMGIEAWLSSVSDQPVTEGLQVGDRFVFSNTFFFDVPAAGGEAGGLLGALFAEGETIRSVGAAFGPTLSGTAILFDPSTGALTGEVNVNTTEDGGPQATETAVIEGMLAPDGSVSGAIEHSSFDLAFEGTWIEAEYAYTDDPDCLGPEYSDGG